MLEVKRRAVNCKELLYEADGIEIMDEYSFKELVFKFGAIKVKSDDEDESGNEDKSGNEDVSGNKEESGDKLA